MAKPKECPHGELIGMPCPPCQAEHRRGRSSVLADTTASWPITTTAKFETRCPGCGDDLAVGDGIAKVDEDEPWVCFTCARAETTEELM